MLGTTSIAYMRICMLLTIGYFLFKSPDEVLNYPVFMLISESMQIPVVVFDEQVYYSPHLRALIGIIASLLVMEATVDFIFLLDKNSRDEAGTAYFQLMGPLRLLVSFALCMYGYLGTNEILSNHLVFSYSFIEMCVAFLLFVTLKDEENRKLSDRQSEASKARDQQNWNFSQDGETEGEDVDYSEEPDEIDLDETGEEDEPSFGEVVEEETVRAHKGLPQVI